MMQHREKQVLRVRRIAIVFDCLVPRDLGDDVIAFRLIETSELVAQVAGVEILPRAGYELGAEVAGGRPSFWDRRAMRRTAALEAGPSPEAAVGAVVLSGLPSTL